MKITYASIKMLNRILNLHLGQFLGRGWYVVIALLLIPFALQLSYAEFSENSLTIVVSSNGMVKVIEKITPRVTVSSINIPVISNKISNVLVTDEKNTVLNTVQNGNTIRIDSLGASHVTLTYSAKILEKTSGIWNLAYNGHIVSTIILPHISDIISVNNIPLDIKDDTVMMPTGEISLSYTVRAVSTNNFVASWNNSNYPVNIITSSKVDNFGFVQNSKTISLTVDNAAPMLVIIPKLLLGGPYGVQLNDHPIEFKEYYQNSTHSWLKIDPTSSGSIKIIGTSAIPEFPIALLVMLIAVTLTVTFYRIKPIKI
ncbi:MAG TPA: hypothetical protein VGR54_04975 [Nitrosopumilaceae archaeon]|nr:hypothetical protein [Nitrosopumilaceae archaeon]